MLTRRVVGLHLPVLMLGALVVLTLLRAGHVPAEMATHFDGAGRVDGTAPRAVGLAFAPVLAAAAVAVLGVLTRGGTRVRDPAWLAAACYGGFGFATGVQLSVLRSNEGVARATEAHLRGLVWLLLTVPLAALGGWAGRRVRGLPVVERPEGVDVVLAVEGDTVELRLHGPDALAALQRRVRLSRAQLLAVEVVGRETVRPLGTRLPGTSLPGVVTAGSFGTGGDREFWSVRSGDRVVVLSFAGGPYRRVVVQPADASTVTRLLALSP